MLSMRLRAIWEFSKLRGPDIDPNSRAFIIRTPTKRTSINGNGHLNHDGALSVRAPLMPGRSAAQSDRSGNLQAPGSPSE